MYQLNSFINRLEGVIFTFFDRKRSSFDHLMREKHQNEVQILCFYLCLAVTATTTCNTCCSPEPACALLEMCQVVLFVMLSKLRNSNIVVTVASVVNSKFMVKVNNLCNQTVNLCTTCLTIRLK